MRVKEQPPDKASHLLFDTKGMKKRITNIIIIVIGFILSWQLVRFFVVDENASTRITFHDFYRQDKIDVSVVGTSRAYSGFNPAVADEILGKAFGEKINSFDLATPSQRLSGSYYVARELLKRYDPRLLFFEVEFTSINKSMDAEKAGWIIADYMKGTNKYRYVFDSFGKGSIPILLSGIYRFRYDIDPEFIMTNARAKLQSSYRDYCPGNDYYYNYNSYRDRGWCCPYVRSNEGYDIFAYKKGFREFDSVDMEGIKPLAVSYIEKAIDMCRTRGVEIVLFTAPQSDLYLSQSGDYDAFISYMEEFANKHDVRYYNLNLVSDERFEDIEFRNLDHMAADGAGHLTRVLCELYVDENSHSFVKSLEERQRHGVYGILYEEDGDKDGDRKITFEIQSHEDGVYMLQAVQKLGDKVIYDTGIVKDCVMDYSPVSGSKVELFVFDKDGSYIGNALPKALSSETQEEIEDE